MQAAANFTSLEYMPPIPFNETKWGMLQSWELAVPGVYKIITEVDDCLYVVDRACPNCAVSAEIDQYGVKDGTLTYFDYDNGRYVIQYEILLYQYCRGTERARRSLQQELLEIALYGMEKYPGYFGEWTPQHETPWGRLTRYIKAGNGIWFIQAKGHRALALNYVLYTTLSSYAKKFAKGNPGIDPDFTYEDMYWPLEDCAPVVYELLRDGHDELEQFITSRDDLETCLYRLFPDFAAQDNQITEKAGASIHFLKLPI